MKTISLIIAALLISGCTTSMKPMATFSHTEDVDFKNYTVGVQKRAYVGDQVIQRKAYAQVISNNIYSADNDFIFDGGIGSVAVYLNASKNDRFKIVGKNENGNDVIAIPGSHLMFGLNKNYQWDGTVMSNSFWTSPMGSGASYKIEPDKTTFTPLTTEEPIKNSGYVNHEIVYTGMGANGLSFLYREYTFDGIARTAFKQELVYPKNTKEIRFKNYKIEVISATPSELSYRVIEE